MLACNTAPSAMRGFTTPAPVPLGQHEIVVPPAHYSYTRFEVPTSNQYWVAGHFEATGGSGNDIEVLLMDADSFANFQNHHTYSAYYTSPKQTAGALNVGTLPAGTYYLVFNNSYSLFSNKVIENTIRLHPPCQCS